MAHHLLDGGSESTHRFRKISNMAKDAHNKAAEHHENAVRVHRMAAEQYEKGDHIFGKKLSATAIAGGSRQIWSTT
jgi:hypothetical protein